jgi:hypothetical protein
LGISGIAITPVGSVLISFIKTNAFIYESREKKNQNNKNSFCFLEILTKNKISFKLIKKS